MHPTAPKNPADPLSSFGVTLPSTNLSPYSCLACRKRKSGCSRLLPHCSKCEQWGTECIYQLTPARQRKALARSANYRMSTRVSSVVPAPTPTPTPTQVRYQQEGTVSPTPPQPHNHSPSHHWLPLALAPATATGRTSTSPSYAQATFSTSSDASRFTETPLPPSSSQEEEEEGVVLQHLPSPALSAWEDSLPMWGDSVGGYNGLAPFEASGSTTPFSFNRALSPPCPLGLETGALSPSLTCAATDGIGQISSRLLFKLMRYRPAPAQGVSYLHRISRLANSNCPAASSSSGDSDDTLTTSPLPLRSLIMPTDLLYHSSVVRHTMEVFGTFVHQGANPLNNVRLLFRLDQGLVSKPFQLAAMLATAPFSDHSVFQHIHPRKVSLEYHARLLDLVPQCLEDFSPDMYDVLGMLIGATLNLGLFSLHQSLVAAFIRKQQSTRLHLLDHPNLPPRPTHLFTAEPNSADDAPAIRNEMLRELHRVSWWGILLKDTISALICGQKPIIDLDECFVNPPCPDHEFEPLLDQQLANPNSPIYTSAAYPTVVDYSRIKNNIILFKVEVAVLGHRVAQLRDLQMTNPMAWLRALPGLNHELEQWYHQYTDEDSTHLGPSPDTTTTPAKENAISGYQIRVLCSMLIIYLNHFDGHAPDSAAPFPGPALNEALRATGDLTHRTLAECHERSWLYALRLRELLVDSAAPPAFINNTLVIASLYPAAVVCHERIHGMGSAFPCPVDPADRRLAVRFTDEITQVLESFGQLWKANLKVVEGIQAMHKGPFVRHSICIGHLVPLFIDHGP
ncbi:hypothetical protein H4R33_001437 [Dimargaris cristalligena]|nr:hypothetical protein H4R33_001437 [Dimargaris cristalligena]